jgi:hypothetical protein
MNETSKASEAIPDLFDVDVPVPTAEGELFGPGDYTLGSAYVAAEGWDYYALCFREAADELVQSVREGRRVGPERDFLAIPVIFLYRQYLEVRLKELGLAASRHLELDKPGVPMTHDLMVLWRWVRPLLERVGTIEYAADIEQRIKEFCAVDPDSVAFRYPVDVRGVPVRNAAHNVDLFRLKDSIAGINSVLEGWSFAFEEYEQDKSEMYAEYAAEVYAEPEQDYGEP